MIGWRSLGCLILVTGLIGVVGSRNFVQAGDDKTKPEWKAFDKKSGPFYQVLTTKTVQTMTVMSQEIKQEQNQVFYIKWTPGDMVDKNWVVEQQIIGVKMDIDIGGNKIPYDSTTEGAPKNPMSEFFDALTKAKLKFHIEPGTFKVVKVEGAEDFRKKLQTANPQIKALLDHILSEKSLKQMAEPAWAAFPTAAALKDDEYKKKGWDKKDTLDLGPIGTYEFTNDYKWGDKDKVSIKSNVKYKVPDASKKDGLPFVIKSGSLETKESDGYAQFDRAKGRFKESKLDMKLEGKLNIDIGGMATEVSLQQSQNSTVETRDDDPVEAIKKAKSK